GRSVPLSQCRLHARTGRSVRFVCRDSVKLRRILLAAAMTAGAAITWIGSSGGAVAQSSSPQPRIFLTAQNPWVGPLDDLVLSLRVDSAGVPLDSLTIATTVCQRVTTRSEFMTTLEEGRSNCSVRSFLSTPVTALPVHPDGSLEFRMPVQDAAQVAG